MDDQRDLSQASSTNSEVFPQAYPTHSHFEQVESNTRRRIAGVQVILRAELGRVRITVQQLNRVFNGSVLPLDRSVDSPVELFAQGVPFGQGDIVVVEDQFAVRIKKIYQA